MLEQVLMHLNNWFLMPNGVHEDTYTIQDGSITLLFLVKGQYFRVCGSVCNDGLHQYPAENMVDETFDGTIWALAIPRTVIDMACEIEAWQEKNGEVSVGPYQSESFGGYSYTRATDSKTGGAVTWETAFRSRLNSYRKLRENGSVQPTRLNPPPYHPPYNPDYPWR